MKQVKLKILKNKEINKEIWQIELERNDNEKILPGQFVNIKIPGKTLRRPISITDYDDDKIILTYKINGIGTEILTTIQSGYIDIIKYCGNGFNLSQYNKKVLIIGGGIGTAPMIGVIKEALNLNLTPVVIFGYKKKEDKLFENELKNLNVQYNYVFDEDNENVISKIKEMSLPNMNFCTCGPIIMMKKIVEIMNNSGQCSLEERFGCGFGACMGCSVEFTNGMKRICKDGPVFNSKEIIWENLI